MRTVKRNVVELNASKLEALQALVQAYANEKQYWLQEFARKDVRPYTKKTRNVRDVAIRTEYASPFGLQARQWKLALTDSAQTWDMYWQSIFVDVKSKIAKREDFSEDQKHYAYWLLAGYTQFFACMEGQSPTPRFNIAADLLPKVAGFVRRKVHQHKGKQPSIRKARSVLLDSSCYRVYEHNGVQYISIMTLEKGKRIALPLKGHAAVQGNIRIVVDGSKVAVHVPQEIVSPIAIGGEVIGIDFGYTEAMMDHTGQVYGEGFGELLTSSSDARNEKGKKRNKLRDLQKKYAQSSSAKCRAKARHIAKFNLGKEKWMERERQSKANVECMINTGINALAKKKPSTVVTEDLRHSFSYEGSKQSNRRLSSWTRGVLQDRMEFKALAKGFCHKQVNAAYSSQTCPICGFVDAKNRKGDVFMCLHCKHRGHADCVAATNILNRSDDPEITRYAPYQKVKALLLERFNRRLEAKGASTDNPGATVPGKTLDVVTATPLKQPRRNSQRGGNSRKHPTTTQRAKQNQNKPKP